VRCCCKPSMTSQPSCTTGAWIGMKRAQRCEDKVCTRTSTLAAGSTAHRNNASHRHVEYNAECSQTWSLYCRLWHESLKRSDAPVSSHNCFGHAAGIDWQTTAEASPAHACLIGKAVIAALPDTNTCAATSSHCARHAAGADSISSLCHSAKAWPAQCLPLPPLRS
jgi:hypothetical protein